MSKNNIEAIYPLSSVQEGILFHSLHAPGVDPYIIQMTWTLPGKLNLQAFAQAWQAAVDRHPILRTVFTWKKQSKAHQIVQRRVAFQIQQIDWRDMPAHEQEQQLDQYLQADRERGFDFARGPLMRIVLIRLADNRYQFCWSAHHILLDGWSNTLLFNEVFTHYDALLRGESIELEKPRPYGDIISWLKRQNLDEAKDYWQQTLKGFSTPTPLGTGNHANGSERDAEQLQLSQTCSAKLQQLARDRQVTLNTIVQAAWAMLLSRYSGEREVVFGVTVSGRPAELNGVERMVGLFVNSLPLRVAVPPQKRVGEWLKELQQQQVEMRQYEYTPLVDIQKWSEVARGVPLFESLFVFENYPVSRSKGEQSLNNARFIESTHYPLTVVIEQKDQITLHLFYECGRFDKASIQRMLEHYENILESMVAETEAMTSELRLLSTAEEEQLLREFNQTARVYPKDKCIHELFEEQARLRPEATAIVCGAERLSYGEVNERANQLAHYLRKAGVGPEQLVGIFMERSVEMVVGLLAVLKAGGAYLPLDPRYPAGRVSYMLRDGEAAVVLTQEQMRAQLPESSARVLSVDGEAEQIAAQSCANLVTEVSAENLAYVIYTSGSTGQPKGVAIKHGSAVSMIRWSLETFSEAERAGMLASTSICFDLSVYELFVALSGGTKIILATDALALRDLAARDEVTLVNTVPSAMSELVRSGGLPATVQVVNLAGEALRQELVDEIYKQTGVRRVLNLNGPSEDTTYSTWGEMKAGERPTIGAPLAEKQAYVLDENLKRVPVGVSGELYLGGAGLARGYFGRGDLTAERFMPNPYSTVGGERMYRTGDVVRWRVGGELEYLGRIDQQVKVRGFRIELGEIEVALKEHENVSECVVVAQEDETGKRLVAYIVWTTMEQSSSELRQYLKERLPEYMVPAVFVSLEQLPLTVNGKVDRKALPAAELSAVREEYVGPRNAVEEELCRIWTEVLKVERVGIEDNFFELGGDSILSIQIIARAAQAGLQLTPRQLFEQQTIRALAEVVGSREEVQAEQGLVSGSVALTPIQHYFFEQELVERDHYNQALLLELPAETDVELVREVMKRLVLRHDALRLRFREQEGEWRKSYAGAEAAEQDYFEVVDLSGVAERSRELTRRCSEMQQRLNISTGPLLRVGYFELGAGERKRLLIAIHHLAVDGVSWRILVEELQAGYAALARGVEPEWGAKTSSYQQWAAALVEYAHRVEAEQLEYWERVWDGAIGRVPRELEGANTVHSEASVRVSLSAEETRALLQEVAGVYHTQINDVLLTALGRVLGEWVGSERVIVGLEGHGREQEEVGGVDVTQTVGWFTSLYPAVIEVRRGSEGGEALRSVKEQLRRIPGKGVGYGALRYLGSAEVRERLRKREQMEVSFNYLGQFDYFDHATDTQVDESEWRGARESSGSDQSLQNTRGFVIEIVGNVVGDH